jgi:hypothetical protein
MQIKKCTKCQIEKNITDFYKRAKGTKIRSICIECWNNIEKYYRHTHIKSILLTYARIRAKKNNLEFTITENDIDIPAHCPILGIELRNGQGKQCANSPTLDRIVGSLGYIPGNVMVISYKANTIKNNGTSEEHRLIAEYIDKYSKK